MRAAYKVAGLAVIAFLAMLAITSPAKALPLLGAVVAIGVLIGLVFGGLMERD